MEELLEVSDVATILKVRVETVRAWIRSGQLKAVKFGRIWRIDPTDLQAFIDAHRRSPESP